MQEDSLNVVQDWLDYDQSLISTIGEKYYKNNGIEVYSNKQGTPIPNEITNSYPHAYSLVKVLKEFINHNNPEDTLKVLDAGSGSGIFARHFLLAARDENILDRVEVLLADYSKTALENIKKKNMLKEFVENKNYKLLHLDLFNLDGCTTVTGENYKLENLSLVVLNYIYDVLPMIVLRPSIDSETTYEKLQFKILGNIESQSQSINLNSLFIEDRWQAYNIEEQNDLQKKYYSLLEPGKTNHIGQIFYSYGSLAVTEGLISRLNEDGFIYVAEMPHHSVYKTCFQVYGNSIAHFVNLDLISKFIHNNNLSSLVTQDALLQHAFYFRNPKILKSLDEILQKVFVDSSLTDLYADLRQCLSVIISPHSKELNKFLLDKLLSIDPYSCFSYMARANYHQRCKESQLAEEMYNKALKIDYLNDFS
jgi:hypothetical protein